MKTAAYGMVLLAACVILAFSASPSSADPRAQDAAAQKWEYLAVEVPSDRLDKELKAWNELGAKGWHLVGPWEHQLRCYMLFKRPVP